MNPGIVKLVALLQENGFQTIDSGDGETHEFGCDRDYGYVAVMTTPSKLIDEANRLRDVLLCRGILIESLNDQERPCIQATYDPVHGTAILDLMFVHDRLLGEPEKRAN